MVLGILLDAAAAALADRSLVAGVVSVQGSESVGRADADVRGKTFAIWTVSGTRQCLYYEHFFAFCLA